MEIYDRRAILDEAPLVCRGRVGRTFRKIVTSGHVISRQARFGTAPILSYYAQAVRTESRYKHQFGSNSLLFTPFKTVYFDSRPRVNESLVYKIFLTKVIASFFQCAQIYVVKYINVAHSGKYCLHSSLLNHFNVI